MATEIRVPTLGESVVEATVGQWFKQAGEAVSPTSPWSSSRPTRSRSRCPRPRPACWRKSSVKSGDTVAVGAVLGAISDGAGRPSRPRRSRSRRHADLAMVEAAAIAEEPAMRAPEAAPAEVKELEREPVRREEVSMEEMPPSPAARKLLAEAGLGAHDVKGSGRRGQVLKQDVLGARRPASSARARERKPKAPPAPPRAARRPTTPRARSGCA